MSGDLIIDNHVGGGTTLAGHAIGLASRASMVGDRLASAPTPLVSFVKEHLGMFTPPGRAALPIFTDNDSQFVSAIERREGVVRSVTDIRDHPIRLCRSCSARLCDSHSR